jgi:hypothetical protein
VSYFAPEETQIVKVGKCVLFCSRRNTDGKGGEMYPVLLQKKTVNTDCKCGEMCLILLQKKHRW